MLVEIMTWYDNGGGAVKIPEKTSDVINGWPLILFPPNLTIFMQKKIGRKTAEVGFELIKGIFQG